MHKNPLDLLTYRKEVARKDDVERNPIFILINNQLVIVRMSENYTSNNPTYNLVNVQVNSIFRVCFISYIFVFV